RERLNNDVLDNRGQTIIFYDPNRLHQIGYFAAHIILKLAELRLRQIQIEYVQSPLTQYLTTLSAVCYNRQGFNLMNLTPYVSEYFTDDMGKKPISSRLIENALCFTAVMALRTHRQSNEQIIATYGQIIPKTCRKKVRQAYKQTQDFEHDLKLMQLMNKPRANPSRLNENYSHMRIAQKYFRTA
ncbi:MAG: hypothetical protein ABJG88_01895, partial [Litorimonas sp.]